MERKTRQTNVRLLKKIEIYLKKKENEQIDDKRRGISERRNG
jgi:hypothetical protein